MRIVVVIVISVVCLCFSLFNECVKGIPAFLVVSLSRHFLTKTKIARNAKTSKFECGIFCVTHIKCLSLIPLKTYNSAIFFTVQNWQPET